MRKFIKELIKCFTLDRRELLMYLTSGETTVSGQQIMEIAVDPTWTYLANIY